MSASEPKYKSRIGKKTVSAISSGTLFTFLGGTRLLWNGNQLLDNAVKSIGERLEGELLLHALVTLVAHLQSQRLVAEKL